jgi:hypothetical protein
MRTQFLSALFLLAGVSTGMQKSEPTRVENTTYTYGEKITYKIKYSLYFNVNVGEVTFTIDNKPQSVAGTECYHMMAVGKTYGFYDAFFKVRDRFESYVETTSLLPMVYMRDVLEGDYKKTEHVLFNQ